MRTLSSIQIITMAKLFYWLFKRPYQEWNCFSLPSKAPVYFTFSYRNPSKFDPSTFERKRWNTKGFWWHLFFQFLGLELRFFKNSCRKSWWLQLKMIFLITIFQVPISYCGIMPIWRNRDATQKWLKNQLQQNLFSLEILAKLTSRDTLIQYNKILIIV